MAAADTLVVWHAASLARPVAAALDAFAAAQPPGRPLRVARESGASLELARKLRDLRQAPDVLLLADAEVFPALLVPAHAAWYAPFARNRLVVMVGARVRAGADTDTRAAWWEPLTRRGAEVGRADPALAPVGYRTLLAFQLAERHHARPGLAARLLAAAPPRNVRGRSAELVALLQSGEIDYAWDYESVARAAGLRFLRLPSAIDLGEDADSAGYARAAVRVPGARPGDTLVVRGTPIRYALAVPAAAPHPAVGERFAAFLLSPAGRAVLRRHFVDALDRPAIVGPAPAAVARAAEDAGP